MFENIIAQPATEQLRTDILSRRLAPAMLFFGPPATGKGSTAMELARALSCENGAAPWNCGCPSCARHRLLIHADLAMIGPRGFAAEINASRAAFLRDPASVPGRSLFIRSLRKLLARFAPAIWEYEPKSNKTNPLPLLLSLEEELDELESLTAGSPLDKSDTLEKQMLEKQMLEKQMLEKHTDTLMRNAFKLEDECLSDAIPIAQVRKAAYWSRLSPAGKRKTLVIENADRMEDKARNALLKLLEEPPESISIVLTAQRRESLMPTILSRLRPYRFINRSAEHEREIIRRIFRDPHAVSGGEASPSGEGVSSGEDVPSLQGEIQGFEGTAVKAVSQGLVNAYLDSFMPQSSEKLLPLAAFFIAAVARSAALAAKSRSADLSPTLRALGSYNAPIAETAGFDRVTEVKETIAALLSRSNNFEGRSFPRFLAMTLDLVSWSLPLMEYSSDPGLVTCREIWKKRIGEAQSAYGIWNQRPELALESLFCRLREDLVP